VREEWASLAPRKGHNRIRPLMFSINNYANPGNFKANLERLHDKIKFLN